MPSFIKGERTLFVAVGNVDAGIDFSELDARAPDVSGDRRAVTVTLPRARLLEPRVDPGRSRVFERERGLIDRISAVFEDNPTSERELYLLAQRKLVGGGARSGFGDERGAQHADDARAADPGARLQRVCGPASSDS